MGHRRRIALAGFSIAFLAGCGLGDSVEVENDPGLDDELAKVQTFDRVSRLRDLVPGDWDKVYAFDMDATTRDSVESQVGRDVDMPETYLSKGTILVFTAKGEVVRASALYKVYFANQTGGTDAVVEYNSTTGRLVLK